MTQFIEHPIIKPNRIQSRIYQQILFAEAIKNNTLIILPTGLGKTIIMVMVAAHFLKKNQNKQIIISAPTRPLVNQHLNTFRDLLNVEPHKILVISGSTPPVKRHELWETAIIIIATPQTLRNDIISGICNLEKISLLCLDEIHRAVGDDPYVLPVQQYLLQNPKGRVLGFTASPSNKDKLREIVNNAGISNIQYMDEESPQVKPYIHEIEKKWIHLELPDEFRDMLNLLSNYTNMNLKTLKKLNIINSSQIVKNPKRELIKLPIIINKKRGELEESDFFSAMSAYGQLMLVTQASEMLETQGLTTLKAYLSSKKEEYEKTRKNSLKRFIFNSTIQNVMKEIEKLTKSGFVHPKLTLTKRIIDEELNKGIDSRILVFANYKATTNFLVEELSKNKKVRVHRFVGQSSTRYGKGLNQKEQKSVMDQFRSGDYNTLVSTSVGEEGLDVAQCDLVIFYDVTPSTTRLIQRSGRTGRRRKGKVIIFIIKGTRDEGYFYASQYQKAKIRDSVAEVAKEIQEKRLKIKLSRSNNQDNNISLEKKVGLEIFLEDENHYDDTKHHVNNEINDNLNELVENPIKNVINDKIKDKLNLSFDKNEDKPIIYIDYREKGSGLIKELLKLDIRLKQINLPIGDFVLSTRVGIERKTTNDFCKTLIKNKLFEQLINLKQAYSKPLLILEGEQFNTCSINPASIRGAIASISIDLDIPILHTANHFETAEFLYIIAKREQRDRSKRPKIRKATSGSLEEEQLFLISALPNIDRILAERLLIEFNNPRDIINAHPDKLRKIQGIGPKKADRIDNLLSTPFEFVNEDD